MTDLEKVVQREVIQFFEGLGCRVYRLGGNNRATRQSAGLPDLWIFCPRKHTGMWFEVKAAWGRPSPDQITFADSCEACRVPYGIGGMPAARLLAGKLGLTWEPAA